MKNRTLNKILVVLVSMFGCVGVASAITVGADQQWNNVSWIDPDGQAISDNYVSIETPGNNMAIRLDEFATHKSDANNNTSLGTSSLNSLTASGVYNTAIGSSALTSNTSGIQNTSIGSSALAWNTTGMMNSALGDNSLYYSTSGNYNSALGDNSLFNNSTGSNNTAIGKDTGLSNSTGSGNIFLGYQAGYNETGSDKLYISNSNTASPLIYGDFSAGEIKINGNLKTNTLQDANGVNMIRKVGDVVHIGANSITLEDSTTSSSGKDEIGSTINDLQIGTGVSHNTTIEGTLTVQTPTADGHAATKSYVDTQTSSFTSDINSNISSINSNTSNITINTNDIKNLSTGLAQSMAMASLATPAQGRSSFSIGTGYYDGKSALAYGFARQNKEGNGLIRIMGASASGINSGAASFNWGF